MYDVLIQRARIVDGTGAPWFQGAVVIDGDRLEVVRGNSSVVSARWVIDAAGLVVAPGFVDMHSHSDLLFALPPSIMAAKVLQGVTTDVIGVDGLSYAPLSCKNLEAMKLHLAGLNGLVPGDVSWSSVAQFLSFFRGRVPNNVAYLVPHAALRLEAMGWEDRSPSEDEIAHMERLLDEALDEGAFGLSTALTYAPCSYARTEELVRLCRVVARRGGIFTPHMRSTLGDHLLDPLREVISVARESGVKLQISHLNCFGAEQKGRGSDVLALIDDARQEGLDVTFDAHPYPVANIIPSLTIPQKVYRNAGPQGFLRGLRSAEVRAQIEKEMIRAAREDPYTGVDWGKACLNICSDYSNNKGFEGSSIEKIAHSSGRGPFETICDLMLEEKLAVNLIKFGGCREDIRTIMQHTAHMFCSDGLLWGGKPHPRGFGTYPRILRQFWRREAILPLEEAIMKMAFHPARRLGLEDRGMVRSGMKADLVVFDPYTVRDQATYSHPKNPPLGIEYVFVNGKLAVKKGRFTGVLAGEPLLSQT